MVSHAQIYMFCNLKQKQIIRTKFILSALLCAIHGATVENTLFEDSDGANTFRAFNPTQAEETYLMVPNLWGCFFQ